MKKGNREGVHYGMTTCVCPLLGKPHFGCNPPNWETVNRLAKKKRVTMEKIKKEEEKAKESG